MSATDLRLTSEISLSWAAVAVNLKYDAQTATNA